MIEIKVEELKVLEKLKYITCNQVLFLLEINSLKRESSKWKAR